MEDPSNLCGIGVRSGGRGGIHSLGRQQHSLSFFTEVEFEIYLSVQN